MLLYLPLSGVYIAVSKLKKIEVKIVEKTGSLPELSVCDFSTVFLFLCLPLNFISRGLHIKQYKRESGCIFLIRQ